MAHGAWPGAPGNSSRWWRLLRLSRRANGSSPIPAQRPRALPQRPRFSVPADRPNWFFRSGMVPCASPGDGGGPSRCPSRGPRGARWRNPGLTGAAGVQPRALGAPRRQVRAPVVAGASPLRPAGSCGRPRLPRCSRPRPTAPRDVPAALGCPGRRPRSVTARKAVRVTAGPGPELPR